MNPIPTLLLCARFGYAALAMLSPDVALALLPLLDALHRPGPAAAGTSVRLRAVMLETL